MAKSVSKQDGPGAGGRPAGAVAPGSERRFVGHEDAARLALERVAVEIARAGRGDFPPDEGRAVALVAVAVALGVALVEDVDETQLEAVLPQFTYLQYNKVKGRPFKVSELKDKFNELLAQ